jgi:hypothetical protein
MWDGVKNSGSRRITNSFTKSHTMRGNRTEGKIAREKKSPNSSKVWGSNAKEIL